jgi:hypothetical protein
MGCFTFFGDDFSDLTLCFGSFGLCTGEEEFPVITIIENVSDGCSIDSGLTIVSDILHISEEGV